MQNALLAVLLLSGALFATVGVAQTYSETVGTPDPQVLLHVPDDPYRRDWVLLGSFSVLADDPENGAKELHIVYAASETVEAYRSSGKFPDGAVLVKDVYAAKTEAMTTGTASYADKLTGRFVMVKDSTDANASSSALWGDGWGWAFYDGTETRKTVTTDYRQDCLGCHEPARHQDLIFVQGYPILIP